MCDMEGCEHREDRVVVGERVGGLELMVFPYVDPPALEARCLRSMSRSDVLPAAGIGGIWGPILVARCCFAFQIK